jgi:O-antigen ligase
VAIALAVSLALVLLAYAPVRNRVFIAIRHWKEGDVNVLLSNRLTAFAAAYDMIKHHPIVGVGPGCYGFQYFNYKIRAEMRHPSLAASMSRSTNFAEVHNDHLQIAAETGVPGYILFIIALAIAASPSFQRRVADRYCEFARLTAAPLVAVLFISSLAHFPLQLAVSTSFYVSTFAVTRAWSMTDES